MDYTHFNPVKYGSCGAPGRFAFHRYVNVNIAVVCCRVGGAAAMNRNRPANGSDAKRRKQAADTTVSGVRTGHRSRRNALALFRPTLAAKHFFINLLISPSYPL